MTRRLSSPSTSSASSAPPAAPAFPPELLERPGQERYAYFCGKVVAHARVKEAYDALMAAIRHPGGASLVLVYGPTGVGKSTLRLRVERDLREAFLADPNANPGHYPAVGIELPSWDRPFDWKDYYVRLLQALDEPLRGRKIEYTHGSIRRNEQGQLCVERRIVAADLRRVLEEAIRERKPRVVLLDEAQHLTHIRSGRRLLDQMENIKSVAALTGTLHVLVGTYGLLPLRDLSAQLSRRTIEIHFPRYRAERPEDLLEFRKLLRTLERHLPLAESPDLEGRADWFYERCLGCTGLLKDWLNRALGAALDEEARTLTATHLTQTAASLKKLRESAQEIREGERALEDHGGDEAQLQALLGIPPALPSAPPQSPQSLQPPQPPQPPGEAASESAIVRRTHRPGQRVPKRDPVGKGAEPV